MGKELDNVTEITNSLLSADIPKVISHSLHQVKSKYWKTLSSLTHVGHTQIKNWLNPNGVEPNYPEAGLVELANFAAFMSVVAGRELALRSNNPVGATTLYNMLPALPSA